MKTLRHTKTALVAISLGLILGTAVARDEPMLVPERISVQGKPDVNQARLHEVLIRAAARRNWTVQSDAPGEMLLKQSRQGKHEATVKVNYDDAGYQLSYASSYNLNADPAAQRIHPTYNMWLRNLSSDISSEISLVGVK